jgi:hypothetical protein
MIDLKLLQNEIDELSKQLQQKRDEYAKAKTNNLKEQFGDNFGCDNCAYGCCIDVLDYHTCCTLNYCVLCRKRCDQYMPDNKLSIYIREYHYYDEHTLDTLNDLFDVSDIMQHPELYQKALDVLALRDKGE